MWAISFEVPSQEYMIRRTRSTLTSLPTVDDQDARLGDVTGPGMALRGPTGVRSGCQTNVIASPSVRFETALPVIGSLSRYQAWKYQVSPAVTGTNPVGVG